MIDNIMLTPLEDDILNNIMNILNSDPEINKFVIFRNKKQIYGIVLNNKVIGLFELCKFIENNVAIHAALLKDYRNMGFGGIAINKIVQEYGENNPDSEYFIANIDYKNTRAIKSIEKAGWEKTDEYNEVMIDEGSQFFIIYKKKNPMYRIKKKELLI